MRDLILMAGVSSTTLFVISYLPMLYRAVRTRDLRSYSRLSLVLANLGNVVYAVYVYSLPAGPIWFLHGFYLGASALMLGLHLRHIPADPRPGRPSGPGATTRVAQPSGTPTPSINTTHQGVRHDNDDN